MGWVVVVVVIVVVGRSGEQARAPVVLVLDESEWIETGLDRLWIGIASDPATLAVHIGQPIERHGVGNGQPVGAETRVTNDPGDSAWPDLSWNGTDWGTVWHDSREGQRVGHQERRRSEGQLGHGDQHVHHRALERHHLRVRLAR